MTYLAFFPLEMKVLLPLMRQPSALRTAVVRIEPGSEPLLGSVSAKAIGISPVAMPGRRAARCSSLA